MSRAALTFLATGGPGLVGDSAWALGGSRAGKVRVGKLGERVPVLLPVLGLGAP